MGHTHKREVNTQVEDATDEEDEFYRELGEYYQGEMAKGANEVNKVYMIMRTELARIDFDEDGE